MQKWTDRFSNHGVHAKLQSLVDEFNSLDMQGMDVNAQADYDRLKTAIDYVQQMFNNTLPHLVPPVLLNNIDPSLNNALNEVRAYKSNKNAGHLNNANSHMDTAISQAALLPVPATGKKDTSISSLISALVKRNQEIENDAAALKEKLKEELDGVKKSIAATKGQAEQLNTAVQNEKASVANIAAQFQKQFSDDQAQRLRENADRLQKLQDDLDVLRNAATTKFVEQKDEFGKQNEDWLKKLEETADGLIRALEEKNGQASKLLDAVGNITHAYGYSKTAQEEGDIAKKLRGWAVFFMVASVVVLVVILAFEFFIVGTKLEWTDILLRIPVSLVILAPAIYLASEASKHRELEVENKRIELELAALNPFLEFFDADEKQKVKERLVKNYFVGHVDREKKEGDWLNRRWFRSTLSKVIDEAFDRIPGKEKPGSESAADGKG